METLDTEVEMAVCEKMFLIVVEYFKYGGALGRLEGRSAAGWRTAGRWPAEPLPSPEVGAGRPLGKEACIDT